MFSKAVIHGCPSAVVLLISRPNHPLLRFSMKLTHTCQGGEWRRLWGQSRQKAASWGTMPGFIKMSILLSATHTQGGQDQELKGSYSFWKTWGLEKQRRNFHQQSISQPQKIDSWLHWTWESREVHTYGWEYMRNVMGCAWLDGEIIVT